MAEGEKRDLSEQRSEARWRGLMVASVVQLAITVGLLTAAIGLPSPLHYHDMVAMGVVLAVSFSLGMRATVPGYTLMSRVRRDPALEDERVRANRASAARFGFWTCMLAAVASFVAAFFTPITLIQAAPLLVSAGASAALLRFALLEARGA